MASGYEIICPVCGAKSSEGFNASGSWWEIKCRRCRSFYHYGELPTGGFQGTYFEFRCPYQLSETFICRKLHSKGILEPGSWFETICVRCHQIYHYGHAGGGALVSVASVSFPQPFQFQPGGHAKMRPIEGM